MTWIKEEGSQDGACIHVRRRVLLAGSCRYLSRFANPNVGIKVATKKDFVAKKDFYST